MMGQMTIDDFLHEEKPKSRIYPAGTKIGRVVGGEVETATILKVDGSEKYPFYRTDNACYSVSEARTDFEQMEKEAKENRKQYECIEINVDELENLFICEYPPRKSDGHILYGMVAIYNGMLYWKEDVTYQFLDVVKDIKKAYGKKKKELITDIWGKEREYKELEAIPFEIKRMYRKREDRYAEIRYMWYELKGGE